MPRRKLFKPSAANVPLTLTDRHYKILNAVGSLKYLTGSLLAALLMDTVQPPKVKGQPTGQVIKRAMAELFWHGYLGRPRSQVPLWSQREGSHELIYTLTRKGREALEQKYPGSTATFILPSTTALPAMFHTLMLARFRITLLKALPTNRPLSQWQQGKHLKATVTLNGERTPVIPDAFFSIQYTDQPTGHNLAHFFIEADRSTMTLKRFRAKLLAYQSYYNAGGHTQQHGIKGYRVLTITPSSQRRDNLKALTTDLDNPNAYLFASETDYDPTAPQQLLMPIWYVGTNPQPRELLPNI